VGDIKLKWHPDDGGDDPTRDQWSVLSNGTSSCLFFSPRWRKRGKMSVGEKKKFTVQKLKRTDLKI